MELPQDTLVSEMEHEELYEEYDQIGNELFFGTIPDEDKQEELYDRRTELWNEMKSRVDPSIPTCPECGASQWTQTPGDPKECSDCGYQPQDQTLIKEISEAWEEIMHP